MRSWESVSVPKLPVGGPHVGVYDSATRHVREVTPLSGPGGTARMYVCGITPYDATHMGHAATYVAFDLLNRAWRSAGRSVFSKNLEGEFKMATSPVEQKVKSIIADQLGVGEDEIKPESSFIEDLGADSLDIVELVMAMEEEFEVEIPDEEAENIKTVGDAINYINTHKK